MDVLSTPVSYAQIVDWGGSRYHSERRIRHWMGGREELTLGEVLALPVEPWLQLWVVLRQNFMTERGMHEAALRLTRDLLARLEKAGVYLDFRCAQLLEAKQRWLEGAISLGELRVAQATGRRLCEDLASLGSPESQVAGEAACHATSDDAPRALRAAFRLSDTLEDREEGRRARLKVITEYLRKEA
jgi:hypothetical protein